MKTRQINMRVSEEWYEEVRVAAGGEKMSEYIRRAVDEKMHGIVGVAKEPVRLNNVGRLDDWKPRKDLSKEYQTRGKGKKHG